MNKFLAVMFFALIVMTVTLAGCGGGGGGSAPAVSDKPITPTPTPVDPTPVVETDIITGKVIGSTDGLGISNINVTFGTPAITAKTAADGTFKLKLAGKTPLELYPTPPWEFKVDVSAISSATGFVGFDADGDGVIDSDQYLATAIPVPVSILSSNSTNLGTIIVKFAPTPP